MKRVIDCGTGAVTKATGNDPVAQGPFSILVAQGQFGMVEHLEDRLPIVEELHRQRPGLLMMMTKPRQCRLAQADLGGSIRLG